MNVELWITILCSLTGFLIGSQIVIVILSGHLARRVDELEERVASHEPKPSKIDEIQTALHSLRDSDRPYGGL